MKILLLGDVMGPSGRKAVLDKLPNLINKKKNLKSKIPFGPYIIISGILYFCYGINFLTLF